MTKPRWQDVINLFIGSWLFVSPWIMRFSEDVTVAASNAYILGMGIALFAAVAAYVPKVWEEGINMALGVWAMISPWLLGFATHTVATRTTLAVGVVVTVLAAWAMLADKDFEKWWQNRQVTD